MKISMLHFYSLRVVPFLNYAIQKDSAEQETQVQKREKERDVWKESIIVYVVPEIVPLSRKD